MFKKVILSFFLLGHPLIPMTSNEPNTDITEELESTVEELWDNIEYWSTSAENFEEFKQAIKDRIKELAIAIQKIKDEFPEHMEQ